MTPDHSADFKAVLIVLLSYLMFSCADALVKYNAQFLGTFEIMFWDSFFTALVMLGYVIFCKGFEAVKTEKLKYHIIKGGFNSFFIWLVIFGLAHTTLAEFYLLIFTAPMWVVLFSMLINKERFDLRRFFYVLLGFGVIAWTVFPEGGLSFHIGTAAVLFLAAGFGFTIIYVRRYLAGEPTALLGGFNSLMIVLALGAFTLPNMRMELLPFMPYLALTGILVFYGAVFLARAYHIVSHAAILAPVGYVQMIYGAGIGFLVFSEVPSSRTITGSIALVFTGLCLFWYDYNKNKKMISHGG